LSQTGHVVTASCHWPPGHAVTASCHWPPDNSTSPTYVSLVYFLIVSVSPDNTVVQDFRAPLNTKLAHSNTAANLILDRHAF